MLRHKTLELAPDLDTAIAFHKAQERNTRVFILGAPAGYLILCIAIGLVARNAGRSALMFALAACRRCGSTSNGYASALRGRRTRECGLTGPRAACSTLVDESAGVSC